MRGNEKCYRPPRGVGCWVLCFSLLGPVGAVCLVVGCCGCHFKSSKDINQSPVESFLHGKHLRSSKEIACPALRLKDYQIQSARSFMEKESTLPSAMTSTEDAGSVGNGVTGPLLMPPPGSQKRSLSIPTARADKRTSFSKDRDFFEELAPPGGGRSANIPPLAVSALARARSADEDFNALSAFKRLRKSVSFDATQHSPRSEAAIRHSTVSLFRSVTGLDSTLADVASPVSRSRGVAAPISTPVVDPSDQRWAMYAAAATEQRTTRGSALKESDNSGTSGFGHQLPPEPLEESPDFGNKPQSAHSPSDYFAAAPDTVVESKEAPNASSAVVPSSSTEGGLRGDAASAAPGPGARLSPEFRGWEGLGEEQYRLVRLLGQGSYGEVAEGFDFVNKRKVAIKRVVNVFAEALEAKRIYREMYILRMLQDHNRAPEVIGLLDVVLPRLSSEEGHTRTEAIELYLVFEYVDTDLHKLILSPQYLTALHIQTFLHQLLLGIKYIHSASVIHRDLKPANILVNEDCSLKVCDFGLSRVVATDRMENGKTSKFGDPPRSVNDLDDFSDGSSVELGPEDGDETTDAPLMETGPTNDMNSVKDVKDACMPQRLRSLSEGSVDDEGDNQEPQGDHGSNRGNKEGGVIDSSSKSDDRKNNDHGGVRWRSQSDISIGIGGDGSSGSGTSSGSGGGTSSGRGTTNNSSSLRRRLRKAAAAEGALSTADSPMRLERSLTKHVVTRWYRAPELILLQDYSSAVDMWSVGCIFAELLSMQRSSVAHYAHRRPLFPGRSCFPLSAESSNTYQDRRDQLNVIFGVIGTPSTEDVDNMREASAQAYLRGLPPMPPKPLHDAYPGAPDAALDLLSQMLCFSPERRISVDAALAHPFLAEVRDPAREAQAQAACGPLSMDFEDLAQAHALQASQQAPNNNNNGDGTTAAASGFEADAEAAPSEASLAFDSDSAPDTSTSTNKGKSEDNGINGSSDTNGSNDDNEGASSQQSSRRSAPGCAMLRDRIYDEVRFYEQRSSNRGARRHQNEAAGAGVVSAEKSRVH